MEIKVCRNCRKLFKYIYGPELCQDCISLVPKEENQNNQETLSDVKQIIKEDEEKYEQVKNYIVHNPKASIMQISQASDVKVTQLLDWVRNERLEFSEESRFAWFECEKCGAKIKSGRLCNRCKIK